MTGSGISAESGVPTFRGAGGYWQGRSFMELATPEAFHADPRLVWDWYLERRATCLACQPNAAHRAIADWAGVHPSVLVTQNVDGLHERAGHEGVVRFHGSLWQNRCTACGKERATNDLRYDELPRSACCDAVERPGVVWFGEPIPQTAMAQAVAAIEASDVMLVVGTSGVVQPAAGLADAARHRGAVVIVVNPEATPAPASIVLPLPAGDAVPFVLKGGVAS
jgi:NAD-dependent deacetylase